MRADAHGGLRFTIWSNLLAIYQHTGRQARRRRARQWAVSPAGPTQPPTPEIAKKSTTSTGSKARVPMCRLSCCWTSGPPLQRRSRYAGAEHCGVGVADDSVCSSARCRSGVRERRTANAFSTGLGGPTKIMHISLPMLHER
jgi:hypothetical protein